MVSASGVIGRPRKMTFGPMACSSAASHTGLACFHWPAMQEAFQKSRHSLSEIVLFTNGVRDKAELIAVAPDKFTAVSPFQNQISFCLFSTYSFEVLVRGSAQFHKKMDQPTPFFTLPLPESQPFFLGMDGGFGLSQPEISHRDPPSEPEPIHPMATYLRHTSYTHPHATEEPRNPGPTTTQFTFLTPNNGLMDPPKNKRKPKAPTLRENDWEPHKARIRTLHIEQKLPLREIQKKMENDFGFSAE